VIDFFHFIGGGREIFENLKGGRRIEEVGWEPLGKYM